MTERPKKDNNFNNSFHKPENSLKDILFTPLLTPLNENDIERVVKVPVRFIDDPDNEIFFLHIPEKKLNTPGLGSVLKIEFLKDDNHNVSNASALKPEDYSLSELDKSNKNSNIFKINVVKTESATSDFGSALEVLSSVNMERKTDQNAFGNFDLKSIQSAISSSQNSLVKDKQPFIKNKSISDEKKVHRQRVLVYRGSTKHQPTNSSSQRRWLMKKVVRKRIRRMGSKNGDDLETSASAPVAVIVNDPREVSFNEKDT